MIKLSFQLKSKDILMEVSNTQRKLNLNTANSYKRKELFHKFKIKEFNSKRQHKYFKRN